MNNRDMFYQNLNQGYANPGMYTPPSGYNMNTNYQAYGPNIVPNNQMYSKESYEDYINDRLDKIDRQIKNLDTRLQKIESTTTEGIYTI